MEIVVVTDYGVDVYKKWADVKRIHSLEKHDFVQYNKDYIAYMDKESHQISKDIKLIEQVATNKIFPKPKMTMPEMLSVATFGLIFLQMF